MTLQIKSSKVDLFVPDEKPIDEALARTTHMAIAAHQDDIEIYGYAPIAECYGKEDKWFTGVTVTDGAGSARSGLYADYTDGMMQAVRIKEQRKAAYVGDYAAQIQLRYSSKQVKDAKEDAVINDLYEVLMAAKPQFVYLHNPADKHDTHIGTMLRAIAAIRKMPKEFRPKKVTGCEVWRNLDWLNDDEKVILPTDKMENMGAALISVYDSQISGGKRYDLAIAGRRLANATYFESHAIDSYAGMNYGVDLTPLIDNPELSVSDLIVGAIDRFRKDVVDRLAKLG